MRAVSIPEVVTILDTIIADCRAKQSRLGYFAMLYKLMTEAVIKGIGAGIFQDNARMEKLDVQFANRYLEAYFNYTNGKPVTTSWKIAFDAAKQDDLIVVQHLLLGINAHINLDLGIAAADICTVDNVHELQADFVKINDTIADVYGALQPRFVKISWPAIFLSKIDPRVTNAVINFSIVKAREVAWGNALLLCNSSANRDEIIDATDNIVLEVANAVKHPSALKNLGLKIIHLFESKDVAGNIDKLGELKAGTLS
ncbi:MAG: hypothetical protein EOO02_00355 [Chitinophagaceae bacterium]|nr:MAG: hypothetical protein EOO02_00355 [Chitinophagaceae bacterium]